MKSIKQQIYQFSYILHNKQSLKKNYYMHVLFIFFFLAKITIINNIKHLYYT
jgi:hypothetical protein